MVKWLNYVTGWDVTVEELITTGERLFNLKRLYNVRCGISRKDDTLPPRILTHKRGSGGAADNLPPFNAMLAEYYAERGWSEEGIPTKEKLRALGLEEYAI
jgi:aldehyde:ferredoxin oxidoreductase